MTGAETKHVGRVQLYGILRELYLLTQPYRPIGDIPVCLPHAMTQLYALLSTY